MPVYLVTYDLNSPGQNHAKVLEKIKSFGDWRRLSESSYAVLSTISAKSIYDGLEPLIDKNDRLLVIPMHKPYWGYHDKGVIDWLSNHLSTCS
ncbi:hypothetical protein EDC59_102212 [Pseudodesulfovibrio indicus]|uniref:Uncharacterized protein n=1 Tax=Pseudodesulfovibrio indicus TaxID=1716143 RepID=A0AA94PX26_9BACT|nr:hypothetical protein EDC59_102212 [Pseudodesulfovibrio indicus]